MGKGISALKQKDPQYFLTRGGSKRSHFREDVRLIAGGALAAAFVASAFTGHIDFPWLSDSVVTFLAAVIGGVGAKYVLV